ncbi:hypothetical protein NDU88_003510 [Pleurodeles waltl]|uniref:Uncharacterized protein n=1 Tax=Pleurodeles waltl TaxID=8319 RepID=A0AAV7PCV9_PLEWA|nr:hypothetical protein NDU88_003510 [Pleurodeles waltl]
MCMWRFVHKKVHVVVVVETGPARSRDSGLAIHARSCYERSRVKEDKPRGFVSRSVCECDVTRSRAGIGWLQRRVAHGLDAVRGARLEGERQPKSIPGIKVTY